jgi:hypothetical protein
MRIENTHERLIAATPERVAELVADFDRIWPTQIAPAPLALDRGRFDAGPMLWEEVDRPGAARAFRVARPDGLRAEHWFEVHEAETGTLLRHTVEGSASGPAEMLWLERIAPVHDTVLEALLDNVEAAAAGEEPTA